VIELVSESRCIKCDVCIRICPTNVFEHGEDRVPVIKRQADCQTCFMCEAWCPTDALFVAPQTTPVAANSIYRDEAELARRGLLGSYRREIGWGKGLRERPELDTRQTLSITPLGVENRRVAAPDAAQYNVGFNVAYTDEGEEADEPRAGADPQESNEEAA
jgi:NAD-dependent dihydropyrimidine dehydrogenase PreA subunit